MDRNVASFISNKASTATRCYRCCTSRIWLGLANALLIIALLAGLATSPAATGQTANDSYIASAFIDAELPEGAVLPRKGLKINIPLIDDPQKRLQGAVVWFNLNEVCYVDAKLKTQAQAKWSEMDPKRLGPFLSSLPDRKSVDSLLTVAEIMIGLQISEDRIEHLYKSALRIDKSASERIDALRAKGKQDGTEEAGPGDDEKDPADDPNQEPEAGAPNANPRAWPKMNEDQHAAAVEQLQAFAEGVLNKMNHKMSSIQTARFLVYSDMPSKETKYWVGLLDKMYDKLCETFDLDKEENIWKGKCLLLFFNSRQDYLRYNVAAYSNNPTGSAGICYQFGKGDVHIAMWRQKQKLQLAHTLVHEAAHGFLFRYQSSYHVPSWLNEGLAEFIAVKLVDAPRYPRRALDARQFVKQKGGLGNFLSARNIIGEHYGLAYDVTEMMVAENRKGYVKMIQGIKKGLSVKEAFDQEYAASLERVFQYYGKSRLKMDNLKI